MPPINTSLIAPLPGAEIAQPDMSLGNFMQGFGAGLRQADPLTKLKQLSMEQDLRMQSAQMSDIFQARQGMADLMSTAAKIGESGGWTDPTAKSQIFQIGQRYPALASTPQFAGVLHQFDVAAEVKKADQLHQERMATEKARQAMYETRVTAAPKQPQAIQLAEEITKAKATLRKEQQSLYSGPPTTEQDERIKQAADKVKALENQAYKVGATDMLDVTLKKADIATLQHELNAITDYFLNRDFDPKENPGNDEALRARAQEIRSILSGGPTASTSAAAPGKKEFIFTPTGVIPKPPTIR